jgi:hypothetical protein
MSFSPIPYSLDVEEKEGCRSYNNLSFIPLTKIHQPYLAVCAFFIKFAQNLLLFG